ncbi:MAG: NADH-dependent [FeFe] hydrogenase, group A6 [Oscillospiraceae bacterium]|nr:NADH-dependent [FeFe] hydrogenase, group A6 [Oscillospiraceae bacterium]
MSMINIKLNNMDLACPAGSTILEAARTAGIEIPTLCYLKEVNQIGACRVCVVEVKGARTLVAACVYPVSEGMEVFTNTTRVREARKKTLELILSNHRKDCLTCVRSQNCELQKLCIEHGVDQVRFADDELKAEIEASTAHLVRDNSKCVLCRRCVSICKKQQDVAVIGANDRGFATNIGSPFGRTLGEMACVSCGQCIIVCPTAALTEKDDTEKAYAALADPKKHVIAITAPAVRVALGECFGMPMGTNVEGKMVASLRRLGFDKVFDVGVGADFTIMEEGTEMMQRLETGENLPIITSCSPGWVRYCEQYYPEFIKNLSSCKSPQQMTGALIKTYYAQKMNIDPKDIFVVSVMPCTAKKYEIWRPNQQAVTGCNDIDVVVTTRELGRMISNAGLMFTNLQDEEFDPMLGISTGAGYTFGVTGGVTEAALRTVVEKLTGKELEKLVFEEVRGYDGIKEAQYDVAGRTVKIAIASGLTNAGNLLDSIKSGEANYDMIEVMGCPGGCVNGGGQPIQTGFVQSFNDLREIRGSALYKGATDSRHLHKSHESPIVKEVYSECLGEPGGEKAHHWLHTTYKEQPKYPGLAAEQKK